MKHVVPSAVTAGASSRSSAASSRRPAPGRPRGTTARRCRCARRARRTRRRSPRHRPRAAHGSAASARATLGRWVSPRLCAGCSCPCRDIQDPAAQPRGNRRKRSAASDFRPSAAMTYSSVNRDSFHIRGRLTRVAGTPQRVRGARPRARRRAVRDAAACSSCAASPGVGKSALLEYALERGVRAARGARRRRRLRDGARVRRPAPAVRADARPARAAARRRSATRSGPRSG